MDASAPSRDSEAPGSDKALITKCYVPI
uniref:Uncharacterized protein n=1 Tax=Arundo donax TaxID=35708 RepID=A0A0A9ACB7_ARUDO